MTVPPVLKKVLYFIAGNIPNAAEAADISWLNNRQHYNVQVRNITKDISFTSPETPTDVSSIETADFASSQAAGSIGLPTNPTANQTLTIGGTVTTFVASGATGAQVNIGATAAATVAALLAYLQASADANISKAKYAPGANSTTIGVTYSNVDTGGAAFSLASNVTGAVLSGATLTANANIPAAYSGVTVLPVPPGGTGLALVVGPAALSFVHTSVSQLSAFSLDANEVLTDVTKDPGMVWTSGTPATATIGANTGLLTGVAAGTTTVTATLTKSGKTVSATLLVTCS